MTVGTELAPGPTAVDITPTKDAGIMKEIKVIKDFLLLTLISQPLLCPAGAHKLAWRARFLEEFYLNGL